MKCLKWEGATRCWCMDAGAGSHPLSHSPCAGCSLQTYSYLGAILWWQILFAYFIWHLSYISYQLTVAFFLKHFLPQAHMTPHSTRLPFTSASASFSVSLSMMVHPKVQSSDLLSFILKCSTGALSWTQDFKSQYCDDVFIIISALTSPWSPTFLSPTAYVTSLLMYLVHITSYIAWIKHIFISLQT